MTDASTSELDQLWQSLSPEELAEIGSLDQQRLLVERSGVGAHTAAQISEPLYGVRACLRMWQALVERMADGWPDTDYYMVYEYLNILTVRDCIEDYIDTMSPDLGAKIRDLVASTDDQYSVVTVADGGAELGQYWTSLAEGQESRWWWLRKPEVLPPGW